MLNSVKIIVCIFLLSFPCFLNISQHFQLVLIIVIFCSIPAPVPGHSQEWRPLIPFPELWEWIFSFPSRSRILGMDFFHSLPVPEFWEWDFFIPFPFPKFGNGFFYSLPVPEFREWAFSIPFPFPNPQKSFPLTPETSVQPDILICLFSFLLGRRARPASTLVPIKNFPKQPSSVSEIQLMGGELAKYAWHANLKPWPSPPSHTCKLRTFCIMHSARCIVHSE